MPRPPKIEHLNPDGTAHGFVMCAMCHKWIPLSTAMVDRNAQPFTFYHPACATQFLDNQHSSHLTP